MAPFNLVIPFCDDSSLLFYFHMTENGHNRCVNKHRVIALNTPRLFILNFCWDNRLYLILEKVIWTILEE